VRVRPFRRHLRGAEIAVLYAVVVLAVFTVMQFQADRDQVAFVQDSSTNLVNMRHFPFRVLLLSSIVVPDARGLLILVPLVVALTACTRWLGRVPTLLAFGFGHVGATLTVAMVLVAQLTHGRLDPGVARAPDVGVSYGLACVIGLLAARVPRRVRWAYVLVPVLGLAAVLLIAPDFTALGHVIALGIGLTFAFVAHRASRAQLP
jgi:hypothetical protein